MVGPRTLGALRVAMSLAALGCAPPVWSGTHAINIGATVVAPSGCRFGGGTSAARDAAFADTSRKRDAPAAYRCEGATASTVSWSVSSDPRKVGALAAGDAAAMLSGAGAAADLRGALVGNDAETFVLTITP